MEVHFDRFDLQEGTGHFGGHAEGDTFVGLDADDEGVGVLQLAFAVKEDGWGGAELDGDFGGGFGQAFADAHVERDAGPAPVVNMEAEGDVSFGGGVWCHAGFFAVAGDAASVDVAFGVLGADDIACDFAAGQGTEGLEDFDFFIPDGVGAEVGGRLHGGEAEELEEVILHHVAEGAGFFIIAGAGFHAEGFAGGDLHILDVAAIPEGFEDGVGEA